MENELPETLDFLWKEDAKMDVIDLAAGDDARKERERIRGLYEAGPNGMLMDLEAAHTLLEQEIALLKEHRIIEVAKLADAKQQLIANIHVYNGVMRERPQWLERVDADTKEKIRAKFDSTQSLLEEAFSYLGKAKRIQEVLLSGIRKGVAKSVARNSGYGASGVNTGRAGAFASPYSKSGTAYSVSREC